MEKIIMVIIGIIIIGIVLIGAILNVDIQMREYCKEQGWDGFIIEIDGKGTCYKEIPHESGLGGTRIHSGRIGLKDKT